MHYKIMQVYDFFDVMHENESTYYIVNKLGLVTNIDSQI